MAEWDEVPKTILAPRTWKELTQFIQLLDKWVFPTKVYQDIIQPLQTLCKVGGNIDRAIQKHSRTIKLAQWHAASQEGLVPVEPTKPMSLHTSNSPEEESGFGAVLYSESWSRDSIRLGRNRPIAMYSIKVPKVKANLSLVTRELGAIAWGLERFKHHIKQAQVIRVHCNNPATIKALEKGYGILEPRSGGVAPDAGTIQHRPYLYS